jgi:hypothetical protein
MNNKDKDSKFNQSRFKTTQAATSSSSQSMSKLLNMTKGISVVLAIASIGININNERCVCILFHFVLQLDGKEELARFEDIKGNCYKRRKRFIKVEIKQMKGAVVKLTCTNYMQFIFKKIKDPI